MNHEPSHSGDIHQGAKFLGAPGDEDTPKQSAETSGRRSAQNRQRTVPTAADSGAAALAEALHVVRRRRLTLLAFVVLVPLIATIAIHRAVPRYTATGTVMLELSAYAVQELQSILRADPASDAVMASSGGDRAQQPHRRAPAGQAGACRAGGIQSRAWLALRT